MSMNMQFPMQMQMPVQIPQMFPSFGVRQPQNPIPLAPALYVGDLDENIREEALYDLFSKFGQIYYIRLMRDPTSGNSRGFAYVNFCNPRDADQARLVAQYEKLGRKSIRIMYKRQNNIKGLTGANVFIRNIDKQATVKDLHTFMSQIGTVMSAKLAVDQKGESHGYGYVQFEKQEDAVRALELYNGAKFKEQHIEITKFIPRQERPPVKQTTLYIKHLPETNEKDLEEELKKVLCTSIEGDLINVFCTFIEDNLKDEKLTEGLKKTTSTVEKVAAINKYFALKYEKLNEELNEKLKEELKEKLKEELKKTTEEGEKLKEELKKNNRTVEKDAAIDKYFALKYKKLEEELKITIEEDKKLKEELNEKLKEELNEKLKEVLKKAIEKDDAMNKYFALKEKLEELEKTTCFVKKDAKIKKNFAFMVFTNSDFVETASKHFQESQENPLGESIPLFVQPLQTKQQRNDELKRRRVEASNQNNLFVKNLKPETTKDQIKDLFSQYGDVISSDVKGWENQSNTKNVKYGFVAFKTPDEAAKAMTSSHENEAIKKLFIDDKPIINIFQNKAQREKFLHTQHRQRYSMPTNFPPSFGANPEMQRQIFNPTRKFPPLFPPPYGMGQPMQGAVPNQLMNRGGPPMNKRPNQRLFMNNNNNNRGGPRPQSMNQGGYRTHQDNQGGAVMKNRSDQQQIPFNRNEQNRGGPRLLQQQQQPPKQDFTQVPKQHIQDPTKPQQPGATVSSITVEDLKKKWTDFIKLDKEKQRNILGELLFPMIKDIVGEQFAPKITGMLIDLDVLEITEIFEFLEDRDLLTERVQEAKQLIESENA